MHFGLPVISVDCDFGPKGVLFGEDVNPKELKGVTYGRYGILASSDKEHNIISAILNLLSNKRLFESYRRSSILRSRDFSLIKIGARYLSTMKEIVDPNGSQ